MIDFNDKKSIGEISNYSCTSNITRLNSLNPIFGFSSFLYTDDTINKALKKIKNN